MSRIDRRHFAKLSALTLAATRLHGQTPGEPPQQSPSGMPTLAKPVGYCPVGLGGISDIFMRACAQTPNARITGLVSGHAADKAPKYQQEFNVPNSSIYTYETYDRIRDNPAIDAVYIGLPNSMHAEYTIRAAEAGKHVLCEKPMAISSAECRKMIDACRSHNVKLMIAYRVHYDPTWQHIRELARNGTIGEIQGFQGGFYGNKREGEWRLDRKLAGGGSLLDLGIYPLNAIRWIAGEEPSHYAAQVSTKLKGPRFASVEESVEFNFKFPSGTLASSGSSYGEEGAAYVNICGTEGSIQVQPAFYYDGLKFTGHGKNGPISGSNDAKGPYQFVYEADHFAACIRNNTEPLTPGEEGLADMLAIEAIYRAAGAPIA
jgi:predicted dehydrogenase